MKLLPCPGCELSHTLHINNVVSRELLRARPVYPGVGGALLYGS
jgi:hypothetical protein